MDEVVTVNGGQDANSIVRSQAEANAWDFCLLLSRCWMDCRPRRDYRGGQISLLWKLIGKTLPDRTGTFKERRKYNNTVLSRKSTPSFKQNESCGTDGCWQKFVGSRPASTSLTSNSVKTKLDHSRNVGYFRRTFVTRESSKTFPGWMDEDQRPLCATVWPGSFSSTHSWPWCWRWPANCRGS